MEVLVINSTEWNMMRKDKNVKNISMISGKYEGVDFEVIYNDFSSLYVRLVT